MVNTMNNIIFIYAISALLAAHALIELGGFMKQVTIENVKARISKLQSRGNAEYSLGLTLNEEFELACLQQLAASLEAKPVVYSLIFRNMEGKLYGYVNVNTTFATMEEAQAYGKGGRYVTQGDGSIKWVADPSLDPVVVPLYTAPPVQVNSVDDDVRSVVSLLENNEWAEHCTKTELGQRLESEITRLVGHVQPVPVPDEMTEHGARRAVGFNRYLAAGYADGWNACRAKIIGNMFLADMDRAAARKMQELTTDNTAQQFEALATSGKSEHLLNAERIAREAKALADRLNATSAVDDDMICYGERCKVCDEMIIGRSSGGLCVSCRDETTSAGSGKP